MIRPFFLRQFFKKRINREIFFFVIEKEIEMPSESFDINFILFVKDLLSLTR